MSPKSPDFGHRRSGMLNRPKSGDFGYGFSSKVERRPKKELSGRQTVLRDRPLSGYRRPGGLARLRLLLRMASAPENVMQPIHPEHLTSTSCAAGAVRCEWRLRQK
jgi:hypothetical protein